MAVGDFNNCTSFYFYLSNNSLYITNQSADSLAIGIGRQTSEVAATIRQCPHFATRLRWLRKLFFLVIVCFYIIKLFLLLEFMVALSVMNTFLSLFRHAKHFHPTLRWTTAAPRLQFLVDFVWETKKKYDMDIKAYVVTLFVVLLFHSFIIRVVR